jgi:Tc5 transposase DNA-binding domain
MIHDATIEFGLNKGSLKKDSVLARLKRNNISGIAHQKVSPLEELEPLIVEWCIRLARIGQPLNKRDVMELSTELIRGTKYAEKLKAFKKKRNIQGKNETVVLGERWYRQFIKRHGHLIKRRRCKVKDAKRHTWCTYEHFEDMYNAVYHEMVVSGIAKETEEEVIMYDVSGAVTTDKTKMYGRPTKYELTHPEELLFVDETGCNTNMKQDGHVGGEMFLLPCEDKETGISGAVTDMHFSVLCFTSGTGEPVLCAVILKSNKDIEDMWQKATQFCTG